MRVLPERQLAVIALVGVAAAFALALAFPRGFLVWLAVGTAVLALFIALAALVLAARRLGSGL